MALLLAAICLYALSLRDDKDWIEKTLMLIRYVPWPYDLSLKTRVGTTLLASACCQAPGLLVPSAEGLHTMGAEFKTKTGTTDVAYYGAVPILLEEKAVFESLIRTTPEKAKALPYYFPAHDSIVAMIASRGVLVKIFDVARIERQFWPPEAEAALRRLEAEHQALFRQSETQLKKNQDYSKMISEHEAKEVMYKNTNATQANTIVAYEKENIVLKEQLKEREVLISKQEAVNNEKEKKNLEQSEVILMLEEKVKTQNETIKEQKGMLEVRDQKIAGQEEKINILKKTKITQTQLIEEKDQQLKENAHLFQKEREKLAAMGAENETLLQQIEKLQQKAREDDDYAEQLRVENAKLKRQLKENQSDNNNKVSDKMLRRISSF